MHFTVGIVLIFVFFSFLIRNERSFIFLKENFAGKFHLCYGKAKNILLGNIRFEIGISKEGDFEKRIKSFRENLAKTILLY